VIKKQMIKTISFDFDGVFVLDSEAVFKKKAWDLALGKYGDSYKPFLREGNSMFGSGKSGGRTEIFRYIYKKLGEPEESLDRLVKEGSETFDKYVQDKILEAGLVPGAMEMLKSFSTKGLSLYLNSGTATNALKRSAKNLKIDRFFKGILGSTRGKTENLLFIASQENVNPEEILVVGDGDSDFKAALELGCPFVGVANKWNEWSSKNKNLTLVNNISDVTKILENLTP